MKKTLSNILSVALALLVLFSTFSFTVEKHYCMGQMVDYSLLGNAESCEMPDSSSDYGFSKNSCCNDVIELIESTNSELKITKDVSLDKIQFVAAFIVSYINLFEGLSENIIPFKDHSPPLLIKNIRVLYQTYLI